MGFCGSSKSETGQGSENERLTRRAVRPAEDRAEDQPPPAVQIVHGIAAVEVPDTSSYIERAWTVPTRIVSICTKAAWISISSKTESTNEGAHRWLNAFLWKYQTALLKRPAPMSKRKFVITTRKTVSAKKNCTLSKATSEPGTMTYWHGWRRCR